MWFVDPKIKNQDLKNWCECHPETMKYMDILVSRGWLPAGQRSHVCFSVMRDEENLINAGKL